MAEASERRRKSWRAAMLLLCPVLFLAGARHAGAQGRAPIGLWLTEDRGGVISVHQCGAELCGTIVGLTDWPANGDIKRDWRGRPQCQSTLLAHLKPQDDGRWHGTVTDPEDGSIYNAEIWVPADGAMRLRGYIGLPLLGSTQKWPPYHGPTRPDCHFNPPPA